jgi:hypothetical protein
MRRNDDFYPARLNRGDAERVERIEEFQIPEEAVTQHSTAVEQAILPDLCGSWTALTLTNGWTPTAGYTPDYRKSACGEVTLRGRVDNTANRAAGNAFPLATLPVGFRPPNVVTVPVSANANQAGAVTYVEIDTVGRVYYQGTAVGLSAFLDLNVRFTV